MAKLIIDIPQDEYTEFKIAKSIYDKKLFIIPGFYPVDAILDDSTNGDVMQIMYDAQVKQIFEDFNSVLVHLNGKIKVFDLDWWNAPFMQPCEQSKNEKG